MSAYRPGEVVLLSFPFSDVEGAKRRPGLVLFDVGDDDIVIARITSQPPQALFDVQILEWKQAGLLLPSVVRLDKVATLEKRLVERRLGSLTQADWQRVRTKLHELWLSI